MRYSRADTCRSATERARQYLPDLVLCDVFLPGESGLDVLAELRADESTESIPFILMTGSHDGSVMRRGMELGADDYLRKPFTANELQTAVAARLRKHERMKLLAARGLQEREARARAIAGAAPRRGHHDEYLGGCHLLESGPPSGSSATRKPRRSAPTSTSWLPRSRSDPRTWQPSATSADPAPARPSDGPVELQALTKNRRELLVEVSLAAVSLAGQWHAVGDRA